MTSTQDSRHPDRFDDPDHVPEAFARLPAAAPPLELEDRVVEGLRDRGLIGHPVRRTKTPRWIIPIAAAAGIALLLLGREIGIRASSPAEEPGQKRWMLLLYTDASFQESGPDHTAEYARWARSLREDGTMITGAEFGPEAMVLGADPTEGIEGPGRLAGYFIVVAPTLTDAAALARTNPHLSYGGRILVRPLLEG